MPAVEVHCLLPDELIRFFSHSGFLRRGGVVTGLDGVALKERSGAVTIEDAVVDALKTLHEQGRLVIINSLRFPLKVIKTLNPVWSPLSRAPLPLVALNGALTGFLNDNREGLQFEEASAHPLSTEDIAVVLDTLDRLMSHNRNNALLFVYPRDWRRGEIIWAADEATLSHAREKYKSASACISCSLDRLRGELSNTEVCMLFLLLERQKDDLMAYQHPFPLNFITGEGVNKASGLRRLCKKIGVDPADCLGAGGTAMDTFLSETGLAIHVGTREVPYHGRIATLKVKGPEDLSALLAQISEIGQQ